MTDSHDAVASGQDTGLTSPRPEPWGAMEPRPTGTVCAAATLERSLREAIEAQAMELTPDQQGQRWPRNGWPIPGHAVELDRPQVGGTY